MAELGDSGEAGSDKTMNMVAKVTDTNKEMAKTMLKIILDFKFSAQNVKVLVTTFNS